jgi:competence protein ComK
MGDNMQYIKRSENGIEIGTEKGIINVNSTLKKYINDLCLKNLSTFEGRRVATSKLLMENNNIPIYINEEIILYPTKSIRCYDTVFVNFNDVLSIKKNKNGHTSLIFTNLSEIVIEISFKRILKQHLRINKILDYLNNNQ